MSKTRARERKKKRLAKMRAEKSAPADTHDTGEDRVPTAVAQAKPVPGKFDPKLNIGGKGGGGKNIPNLAASSRGASRSG